MTKPTSGTGGVGAATGFGLQAARPRRSRAAGTTAVARAEAPNEARNEERVLADRVRVTITDAPESMRLLGLARSVGPRIIESDPGTGHEAGRTKIGTGAHASRPRGRGARQAKRGGRCGEPSGADAGTLSDLYSNDAETV